MERLLGADELPPCIIINKNGRSNYVLTCEHAGRLIPRKLGDLGISPANLKRHIASDIGALELALCLSKLLDCALVYQPYSRLVIDCNRPQSSEELVVEVSDGVPIFGNMKLSQEQIEQRWTEIHQPYGHGIASIIDAKADANLVSIHSYSPQRSADQGLRPWLIGVLFGTPDRLNEAIIKGLWQKFPQHQIGINQPYSISDTDYTLPIHGLARRIPCALLEFRQDTLSNNTTTQAMAMMMAKILLEQSSHTSYCSR